IGAGLVQLVRKFVLRFLKLFDRLSQAFREFRQFLRSEQNQNDEQNDQQIRSAQVHETGQQVHLEAKHRPAGLRCKVIQRGGLTAERRTLKLRSRSVEPSTFNL